MAEKNVKLTPFEKEQTEILKKIVEYKLAAEANIVSALYQEPELFYNVNLTLDDFSNNVWRVYFEIAYKLICVDKKTTLDNYVVGLYLQQHPKLKAKYEEYGGYDTISKAAGYIKIENFYAYYTELKKWQCVFEMCKRGFPVKDRLSDFADMSAEDIYNEFETYLNHIFISVDNGLQSYNVFEGMHQFIDECDDNVDSGLPFYNAKLLNETTGGFNYNGNIYGLGAGSGVGKSTMAFDLLVPSAVEYKEPIVFIINEEDEKKFKKELLIWVANNMIVKKPEEYIHKYMIRDGHFTDEVRNTLIKAADWIEARKEEKLFTVIPLERYSVKTAIKIIKKYQSAYDVKLFVLDTLKESFDAQTPEIFKSMMRDMVELHDVVKPKAKNVGLFVTYQLGKSSLKMRHLTNNEIGQAKSIIDVMSVNLMMRRPYEDEYVDESKALKCYYCPDNKHKNTRIEYKLKREKNPMIMFVTKNRFGETDSKQIIFECDFSTNICKDVAYCIVPQDW